MNRNHRIRVILLTLLIASLFLVSAVSAPKPVEAATCASIGCGGWMYNGCCATNKLYQYRQCCNNGSCCFQFRCNTAALCPI